MRTHISRVRTDLDIYPESRFDGFEKIGIEETGYRKGHKYMTAIVNYDTGRVVRVALGRGKEVLTKEHPKRIVPHRRSNIPNMHWERTRRTSLQARRHSWN